MEKTWLIRTKNNHILGPVSKKKVRELLDKGSIKSDDELCDGNGYWFFVREKELVDKYIKGDAPQGFNPVSEAETVLAQSVVADLDEVLPNDDDLAFPDIEEESNAAQSLPDDGDLAYPEQVSDEIESQQDTIEQLRAKASKKKK